MRNGSVRVVGSWLFAAIAWALAGASAAAGGDPELLFEDGLESGAVCAWSSYVSPAIPGGCVIDGVCYAPQATDPENQGCRICDPAVSQTAWTIVNEGGGCSDADACTLGEVCSQGICEPTGEDTCDDGIGCTDDGCDPENGCFHEQQHRLCDDFLPCTIDSCQLGEGCENVIDVSSCLIDGVCYADETPEPGNPCFYCDAGGDNEQFSQRPQDYVCAPGSCLPNGTQAELPDRCDAKGVCGDFGIEDCEPYLCTGTACLDACESSADCAPGNYCNIDECQPKKANGQACAAAEQCSSSFCVDGFCCASDCTGLCEQCSSVPGVCNPVANGTDPAGECTQANPFTCGQDGFCSGNRTCRLWTSGTACSAAACIGSPFPQQSDPPDLCDGNGTCNVTPAADCGNYLCNGATGLCRTTCQFDFHCDAEFICDTGSSHCVPF